MAKKETVDGGISTKMLDLMKSRQHLVDQVQDGAGITGNLVAGKGQEVMDTFDYIEKHTGQKSFLSTPEERIQKNYIQAKTNDAIQKAEEQGIGGEAVGFLAQSVIGEVVLGTVEGVGYLLDVQNWGSKLFGGEGDWDNWLSSAAASGKEGIRELAPIHLDPRNEGKGMGTSMKDSAWWFSNGVSIASSLSILIPVAGWARGASLIGKGLNVASKGARVGKWGAQAAKATKTVDKMMDHIPMMNLTTKNAIDGIHKATVSRLIESQMEATGVFREKMEWYENNTNLTEPERRKAAAAAASFTYNANWAALVTDIPQYMLLGTRTRNLKKALHTKRAGLVGDAKLLNNKFVKKAAGTVGTMAGEGIEEAYQYIVGEEGKRVGDVLAGVVRENDSTFSQRLDKYSKDSEMWTSAMFGALGGGVFATAGPGVTQLINKIYKKGEGRLTEKDLRLAEERDRYTKLSDNMRKVNNAATIGDEEAVYRAKSDMAFDLAKNAVLANNWDKARSAMAQLKNATPAEQAEMGLEGDFSDFVANIDEQIKNMDVAADIVERNRGKYTPGLSDMISERQFQSYMYKQQLPIVQAKFSEEIHEVVPNMDAMSKDGNVALERTIDILGQEKAIEVLEAKANQEGTQPAEKTRLLAEAAKGKAAIEAYKSALKEITSAEGVLNDADKLAIEAVEGGSADELISLSVKEKLLKHMNNVNMQEINYWTSREGRRTFNEIRAKRYAEETAKKKEEKAKSKANQAINEVVNPGDTVEADTSGENDQDLQEIDRQINEGSAKIEDFANTPEEVADLKTRLAEWKELHLQNPHLAAEDAAEDALLADEGSVTFNEEQEDIVNILDETEESDITEGRDIVGDLHEELTDSTAHAEMEIPINSNNPKDYRVGDDVGDSTLSSIPTQLAWLSSNNERSTEITPQQQALSSFLENPGTIITEYEVQFDVNGEYVSENKDEFRETLTKMSKGILPTDAEMAYLPIKATIMKDGKPVIKDGHELVMNLHNPSFFYKKTNKGMVPKYPGKSEALAAQVAGHKKAIVRRLMDRTIVTTKLNGKSRGKLNMKKDIDGKFAQEHVAKTLKTKAEELNYFVGSKGVEGTTSGQYIDHKGRPRLSLPTSAEPGAIYTEVSTANGSKFPLRLQVSNVSKAEATLIHAIYVDLIITPDLIDGTISDKIVEYIRTKTDDARLSGMEAYLPNLDSMTYQELLDHLVYEGTRTMAHKNAALVHFVNTKDKNGNPIPNSVKYGKKSMPLERLEHEDGKREFITWLVENKRRQVDRNLLGNAEYKKYINSNKIVTTNVEATPMGHVFIQPVISYSTKMEETFPQEEQMKNADAETKEVAVEGLREDLTYELNKEGGPNIEIVADLKRQIKALEIKPDIGEIQDIKVDTAAVNTINETIKMFQTGIKTETGEQIKVNVPKDDDFGDIPC